MKPKVFVDGQVGTTGLQIKERLSKNSNIDILEIDYEKRKDPVEKRKIMNSADLVFLCLPDFAAKESVSLIDNPDTVVIDASTAHRTNPEWTYGMAELDRGRQREKIKEAQFISNPGCHATAFVLAVRPLLQEGFLPENAPVICHSVTGYSGGGKKLIAVYEEMDNPKLKIPRHYALDLNHKHVPEMRIQAGLKREPLFNPIVSNYYKGLAVTVPFYTDMFSKGQSASEVHSMLEDYYAGEKFVKIVPFGTGDELDGNFFDITALNDTNRADIFVFGDEKKVSIMTRIDNLGKGASGAAVQNMNLALGFDEGSGL